MVICGFVHCYYVINKYSDLITSRVEKSFQEVSQIF